MTNETYLLKVCKDAGGILAHCALVFGNSRKFKILTSIAREKKKSKIIYHYGNSSRRILLDFLINSKSTRIIEIHDLLPRNKILRGTLPALLRYFFNKADSLIVHSSHAKTLLGQIYGSHLLRKTSVIPLAVFKLKKRDTPQSGALNFLLTGRITASKNAKEILDAFRELQKNGLDVRLTVAGAFSRGLKPEIFSCASPRITLVDRFLSEEELNSQISAAHYVLNLKSEDLGESSGILARCLALERPTISFNQGSNAEILEGSTLLLSKESLVADELSRIIKSHSETYPKELALVRQCRAKLHKDKILKLYAKL